VQTFLHGALLPMRNRQNQGACFDNRQVPVSARPQKSNADVAMRNVQPMFNKLSSDDRAPATVLWQRGS